MSNALTPTTHLSFPPVTYTPDMLATLSPEFAPVTITGWNDAHSAPQTVGQSLRATTAKQQRFLNENSSISSIRGCRKNVLPNRKQVDLIIKHRGTTKRTANILGTMTCKSDSCISCAVYRAYSEQTRLELLINAHLAAGGTIVMLTLTCQSKPTKTPEFYSQALAMEKSEFFAPYKAVRDTLSVKARNAAHADALAKFVAANPRQDSWTSTPMFTQNKAMREVMRNVLGSNRPYTRDAKQFGIIGYTIVFETKHAPKETVNVDPITGVKNVTRNWNYTKVNNHAHVLVFVEPVKGKKITQAGRRQLTKNLASRWVEGCTKRGIKARMVHQHAEWLQADSPEAVTKVAKYFTKTAYEITAPHQQMTEHADGTHSYSKWQMIDDAMGGAVNDDGTVAKPSMSALNNWWNVENAVKGNRIVQPSKHIYNIYGITQEIADANLERKLEEKIEHILSISSDSWYALRKLGQSVVELLFTCENSSTPTMDAVEYLTSLGFVEGTDFSLPAIEEETNVVLTASEKHLYDEIPVPY